MSRARKTHIARCRRWRTPTRWILNRDSLKAASKTSSKKCLRDTCLKKNMNQNSADKWQKHYQRLVAANHNIKIPLKRIQFTKALTVEKSFYCNIGIDCLLIADKDYELSPSLFLHSAEHLLTLIMDANNKNADYVWYPKCAQANFTQPAIKGCVLHLVAIHWCIKTLTANISSFTSPSDLGGQSDLCESFFKDLSQTLILNFQLGLCHKPMDLKPCSECICCCYSYRWWRLVWRSSWFHASRSSASSTSDSLRIRVFASEAVASGTTTTTLIHHSNTRTIRYLPSELFTEFTLNKCVTRTLIECVSAKVITRSGSRSLIPLISFIVILSNRHFDSSFILSFCIGTEILELM